MISNELVFFCSWTYWKQCKEAFGPAVREHVESIDAVEDALMLKGLGIGIDSVAGSLFATAVLKHGVERDITLFQVGSVFSARGYVLKQRIHYVLSDFRNT
jgi:hypothetical protein